jgi:hypothetical protein
MGLWRLLQQLFGDEPPPRPTGGAPTPARRRRHRHGEPGEPEGEPGEDVAGVVDDLTAGPHDQH